LLYQRLHGLAPRGELLTRGPGRIAAPVLPTLRCVPRVQPADRAQDQVPGHLLVQVRPEEKQGNPRKPNPGRQLKSSISKRTKNFTNDPPFHYATWQLYCG